MRYYAICPVRNATEKQLRMMQEVVDQVREQGHHVHYPPTDVDQNCPTGLTICAAHLKAMRECDAVLLFYAESSGGSKFDLGMAYALDKPVIPLAALEDVPPGKSYWSVFNTLHVQRTPVMFETLNGNTENSEFRIYWNRPTDGSSD